MLPSNEVTFFEQLQLLGLLLLVLKGIYFIYFLVVGLVDVLWGGSYCQSLVISKIPR